MEFILVNKKNGLQWPITADMAEKVKAGPLAKNFKIIPNPKKKVKTPPEAKAKKADKDK